MITEDRRLLNERFKKSSASWKIGGKLSRTTVEAVAWVISPNEF